jgi:phosphoribosylanthranilate isomerase
VKVFVKICGPRDAATVAAAAEAGADAVGFVFAASPRRVTPVEARAAAAAATADVRRVAVMRHPTPDEWRRVLDEFGPDVLQTDAADFEGLEIPEGVARWPVIREGSTRTGAALPETFVYEGALSGRGRRVDWQRAAELARAGHMILAGGLAVDNVADAIRTARPYGVDVSSAVESRPGVKDVELIRQFVNAVRAAERQA